MEASGSNSGLLPSKAFGYTRAMLKQRLAVVALVIANIFLLGLVLWHLVPRWAGFGAGPKIYNTPALVQQVQTLSQLVTVKYVIEKVVVLDDVKWMTGLGENRVLMIAHGVVKAGLDLSQVTPADISVSGKKVVIKLPPAQITDTYLDEKQTRVVERTTGVVRSVDKEVEHTATQNIT